MSKSRKREKKKLGNKKKRGKAKETGIGSRLNAGPFITNLTLFFLIASISVLVYARVHNFLVKSDYFNIKNVEFFSKVDGRLEKASALDVGIEEGDNIFGISLRKVYDNVKKRYPQFKDLKVRRTLPDKVVIEYEERRTFAKIILGRTYFVDKDGILIGSVRSAEDISGKEALPLIVGLSADGPIALGQTVDNVRVPLAIKVIEKVSARGGLGGISVSKIDVSNPSSATFFTAEGVQIRIGDEDIDRRLNRLAETLERLDIKDKSVKYLDLRFDDVVIGAR